MGDFEMALRAMLPDDLDAVADALGVSVRTIQSWVRGERVTTPSQVFALERAVGCAPGSLSRHLGYLPVPAEDTLQDQQGRLRARVAAEASSIYDEMHAMGGSEDVGRLLADIDLERAVAAGLRSEFLRVVFEDMSRELGPSPDDVREMAERDYDAAVAAAQELR